MLLHLIKKDLLIIKKYVLLILATTILIPLFLMWRAPVALGFMSFVFTAVFAVFMLLQYLISKEHQFPKASTLLCAIPYPRRYLVLSKYCFCLIIYTGCCLIYWIETLIFPEMGGFPISMPMMLLLVMAIVVGLYFPLLYKWGFDKTRFVFVLTIIVTPYVLPTLQKRLVGSAFSWIDNIHPAVLSPTILFISLLCMAVSAYISIRIYEQKDLD